MKVNKKVVGALIASYMVYSMVCTTIIKYYKKPRKTRRFAVRPINRMRNKEGFYATMVNKMRHLEWDHEQFFILTRMTPKLFDCLVELVEPYIQKNDLRSKNTILTPGHRLMLTIHYLAHGCSMQQIAWTYRIGKSTAQKVIVETCKVLWDVLSPLELPQPSNEEWKRISKEYYNRWNLPNCIGSLDGKHVTIKAPNNSGSEFFNYKKNFSLILMATCDSYYRFTTVDIGAAGGNHDCTVLKESGFGLALLNDELDIPRPCMLPKTNITFPHYIAADAAFPLHQHIMRPYPGKNLGEKRNIFNYRLSRGRRTIENTFGILSQRWRILLKPIEASLPVAEKIVQATVVLHNYLQSGEQDLPENERRYCPTGYADYFNEEGNLCDGLWREANETLRSINRVGKNNFSKAIGKQRDILADYFVSQEGSVSWQEDYVHRGGAPGV